MWALTLVTVPHNSPMLYQAHAGSWSGDHAEILKSAWRKDFGNPIFLTPPQLFTIMSFLVTLAIDRTVSTGSRLNTLSSDVENGSHKLGCFPSLIPKHHRQLTKDKRGQNQEYGGLIKEDSAMSMLKDCKRSCKLL